MIKIWFKKSSLLAEFLFRFQIPFHIPAYAGTRAVGTTIYCQIIKMNGTVALSSDQNDTNTTIDQPKY